MHVPIMVHLHQIWYTSVVAEEVLVDLHDLDPASDLHADSVLDHELGELEAVDHLKHQPHEGEPGVDR